ncbi:endonuclease/exonuclease/phosphatase family protein [Nocardiopsis gilva]|nr:endonuclease/exonuclease/phosphatase family protein [Nocardiopsis gilva]
MALSHTRPLISAAAATALTFGAVLIPASPAAAETPRVHAVQGLTRLSPYAGQDVADVPGVVTAVNRFGSARGFWFQDPDGDGDPRTSEALFVFTGSTTPDVDPGDDVRVSGTVTEYSPGDGLQTITQLTDADWTVVDTDAEVPAAVVLDSDTIPDTYAPDHEGDISHLELRPDESALDFWEAHEHMVVRVDDAPVVGPTDRYNALWVTTKENQNRSPRGGTVYGGYDDPNSGRLKIESLIPFAERPFPKADVGDELAGITEGPLYYRRFGGYLLKATTLGRHVDNELPRGVADDHRDWELSAATYNVENLSATDAQEKFDGLAQGVAVNLGSPDIVALEEIQDNNGTVNDGTVAADRTLDRFVAAIKDAGGPAYEWRQVSPEDGADGGQPGGNIRNAFLVNPARVAFVDRDGGDATTPVEVVEGPDGRARLSASPGRISPGDDAWQRSRKPLVGEFVFEGRPVFIVTNHFASKRGDQALHGIHQPPERTSEIQRHDQAELVRAFTDDLTAADPAANVMVVGDLNDFQFSRTLEILTADGGLNNPLLGLPEEERYNYVYDGNSQALDHMLLDPAAGERARYEVVRTNAEFHEQVSDHDPQVVRFRPLTGDARIDHREDRRYYSGAGRPNRG